MAVLPTPEAVTGFTVPELEAADSSLQFRNISADYTVLLDPETAFWALAPRDGSETSTLIKESVPLFKEQQETLLAEFKHFREKIDLSAYYINATDRCNGSCPYCYIPKDDRKAGIDMQEADLRAALDKILIYHEKNCLEPDRQAVIIFHGSEPMMVKEMLFSVISDYTGKMRFGLQTNATLVEEADVAFLKEKRVSVGISLDAASEEGNQLTRIMDDGKNAFKAALQTLSWFDGYPGLSIICTVTKHNVHQLSDNIRMLHKLGVKAVLMNPVRCTAPGTEQVRPDGDELFAGFTGAVKTALELTKTTGQKIVVSDFANIILAIVAPTGRRLMCDITPCGGGRRFFTIMSDMTTTPCGEFIGLKDFHGVNMRDGSIEEIMDSPAFKQVRDRVVEVTTDCKDCLYRNLCGAPCPAEVYDETKSLNNPSPYCYYYKELIDFAFHMIGKGEVNNLLREEMLSGMEEVYDLTAVN